MDFNLNNGNLKFNLENGILEESDAKPGLG
jgi:hypothetical protein